MADRTKGLYQKYQVSRTDRTDRRTDPDVPAKHELCELFVLDLTHDRHAIPAIAAYIASCRADGWAILADDLQNRHALTLTLTKELAVAAEDLAAAKHAVEPGVPMLQDCIRTVAEVVGVPPHSATWTALAEMIKDRILRDRRELERSVAETRRLQGIEKIARFDPENVGTLRAGRQARSARRKRRLAK